MKGSTTVLITLLFAGASYATAAHAADAPAKQLTPQQQKMATCSHQAGEKSLKGQERRTFLSGCLKHDGAVATSATPGTTNAGPAQEKKESCRAQAKRQHLAGSARKDFLGSCEQGAHEVAAAR
jgi:hypothetical protein